jgi:restriction endonuclease Mrr
MELLEAVKYVLIKNKKPMHFKEIAKVVSAEKLIEKKGTQTLETVINAKLALEVRKAEKLKIHTDFLKLNNGMVGLKNYNEPAAEEPAAVKTETLAAPAALQAEIPALPHFDSIEEYLNSNYAKIKAQFIEKLNKLPFLVFERLVENLLRDLGFAKYTVVNRRTDGGIDYAINFQNFLSNVNMLVVIRRWPQQRKYGVKNAEELVRVMANHKFNMGAVILFSEYEADVSEYIKANSPHPIALLTIDHLAAMLINRGVGIMKNPIDIYNINVNYISVLETEISQKIEKHKKNAAPNVSRNVKNNTKPNNGRPGFYGHKKPHHFNKNNPQQQ